MKYCKDCKHFREVGLFNARCCHGKIDDPVWGNRPRWIDATKNRESTAEGDCGMDARFFEPKPPEDQPKPGAIIPESTKPHNPYLVFQLGGWRWTS